MTAYTMWFKHDVDSGEPLEVGDALRWDGEVWIVERLESQGGHPVAYLSLWPNEKPNPARIKGVTS